MGTKLIEDAEKYGLAPILLAGLISSDTCSTKEGCEKSLKRLQELQESLPHANIPEERKKFWEDYCRKGLEIVKRDYESLGGNIQ